MNFYSKLLLLALVLFTSLAHAMHVEALYTSLCDRHVGITLYADKRFAYFLTIDGHLKKIPRYQVLSFSSYAIDHLPIPHQMKVSGQVPYVKLWTRKNHENTLLAEGYVLGSNLGGFQILTLQGSEVYISKDSLWKIDVLIENSELSVSSGKTSHYVFAHPRQDQCQKQGEESGTVIYATELMTDPISIKRKFDQQIAAMKILKDYEEAQTFYAVPQIYKKSTSIGYWLPLGNRYGSSSGRVGGIVPLIRNEYSKGPFRFQHLSLTGAGPVPDSIHEETQTMIYYGFKSSYVHFSGFLDPSLVLAGAGYQWQPSDLKNLDEKAVESSHIALGFDRGPFSLTFFLNSHVSGGFQQKNGFTKYDGDMARVGLDYRTSRLLLKFNTSVTGKIDPKGSNIDVWDQGTIKFMHFSGIFDFSERLKSEIFYFSRKVSFSGQHSNGASFDADSQTLGIGSYFNLNRRWQIGGRVSQERTNNKDQSDAQKNQYFKMGLTGSMNF